MTQALVTGGTGFIGAHVVRALLEEGVDVRALVRAGADARNLHGLAVERVEGDLRDAGSLGRALAGADVVFHVAALYDLRLRRRPLLFQVNVQGTRALMQAALAAGVERVVYTSSIAAVGHARADDAPASESDWPEARDLPGPYEESKYLAERLVHDMVQRDGLPAVVVNPTTPIGPLDAKPTPSGRLIRDAANGAMPGYLRSAGLNVVHVRDVARGHVLAWRRGAVGERYILGHREGNLTLHEVIRRAAAAARHSEGGRARQEARPARRRWPLPPLPLPFALALGYAQIDERLVSRLRGHPPRAPIAGVRLARHRLWFDCRKAVEELGLPQSPLDEAFGDAVTYLMAAGRVSA